MDPVWFGWLVRCGPHNAHLSTPSFHFTLSNHGHATTVAFFVVHFFFEVPAFTAAPLELDEELDDADVLELELEESECEASQAPEPPRSFFYSSFCLLASRATFWVALLAVSLGTRLNAKVVPAKWFQCSNKNGRNKKSSKFIYPPTKHTQTCSENMLFASLGAPR